MREILFRGKNPSGEWFEGEYVTDMFTKTSFINTSRNGYEKVLSETVGQYTGLTDKNGKKIFEGDIVKLFLVDGVEVGLIGWSVIDVRYKFASPDGTAYGVDCTCVFEIVGNTHDNPELLKGGAEE